MKSTMVAKGIFWQRIKTTRKKLFEKRKNYLKKSVRVQLNLAVKREIKQNKLKTKKNKSNQNNVYSQLKPAKPAVFFKPMVGTRRSLPRPQFKTPIWRKKFWNSPTS